MKENKVSVECYLIGYGTIDKFEASEKAAFTICRSKINAGFDVVASTQKKYVIIKGFVVWIFSK